MYVCELLLVDLRESPDSFHHHPSCIAFWELRKTSVGHRSPLSLGSPNATYYRKEVGLWLLPAEEGYQEAGQRSRGHVGPRVCWVNGVPPWRLTFCAWLTILRTTSLMCGCPSMGGCM